MNTIMRTIGGVIGGEMGAALLTAFTIGSTSNPSVTGYEIAFAAAAGAALVGAVLAVLVTPRRRERLAVAIAGGAVTMRAPTAESRVD
jgi:membrane associated rhomboid family serine protease